MGTQSLLGILIMLAVVVAGVFIANWLKDRMSSTTT